jgi:hypothetical protein
MFEQPRSHLGSCFLNATMNVSRKSSSYTRAYTDIVQLATAAAPRVAVTAAAVAPPTAKVVAAAEVVDAVVTVVDEVQVASEETEEVVAAVADGDSEVVRVREPQQTLHKPEAMSLLSPSPPPFVFTIPNLSFLTQFGRLHAYALWPAY